MTVGFDSDWEETENLPGDAKIDTEPLLQIGDRVKSVHLGRFGTVVKVHGGLVSTQWDDGFTSTERQDDIQPVTSDESELQSELDETTSKSSPGQQLLPEVEKLEQDSDPLKQELPKPTESKARFLLDWYGNEVEVEGVLVAVLIDWEHQGRTGQTQVPMDKVLFLARNEMD